MNGRDEWWRGGIIYQVYPRSFMDSNGDGVGDLPGIAARMGYIADLGVDAVWISPFFASPMCDFGYDVSDYRAVDPIFGTLADFDAVLAEAHKYGLKVMIDLVVSHTSNRHPWFVESSRDRTNAKADWYTWVDPRADGTPPNNWLSHFGGPAWTWNARRRQYYFHNFLTQQPDLNYHNPEVREAILDVFRFWLDRGVDGFRLDTVNMYFQDRSLRDNPPCPPEKAISDYDPYDFQIHIHDKSQPENLAFLEEVRRLTDRYPGVAMVGEIGADSDSAGPLLASYTEAGKRLHMSYVFELLLAEYGAAGIRGVIERLSAAVGDGWICWSMSNHDVRRVVSRWGLEERAERAAPMLLALLLSLRGSACIYEGEELGLVEADIPFELVRDPHGKAMWPEFKGRDGCRTPMPWRAGEAGAGFTAGEPWLPIPVEHRLRAVDVQEGDAGSVLNRCRGFISWRGKQPLFAAGDMTFVDAGGEVLAFLRRSGGREMLAAFNLGDVPARFAAPFADLVSLDGHGFGGRLVGGEIHLDGFDAFFGEYGS